MTRVFLHPLVSAELSLVGLGDGLETQKCPAAGCHGGKAIGTSQAQLLGAQVPHSEERQILGT